MDGGDIKTEYEIQVDANSETFKFSPERMKSLMDALPCDKVYFYPGEKRYLVTDSTNSFVSVIMAIA